MKRLILLVGIAAVLVCAQDKRDNGKVDDIAKAKAEAAKQHVSLGNYLYSYKMYEWGNFQYKKALQLDPDNADARKKLGFKKDGDQWVKDDKAKLKSRNEEKDEDKVENIWTQYVEKVEKMKSLASKFSSLGDKKAKTDPEVARECYFLALEYDPDNEKLRKKVGHEWFGSKESGEWVSKTKKQYVIEMKEWSKAPKGNDTNRGGAGKAGLNLPFKVRESAHLLIESTALDSAKMATCCQVGEQAYAVFKKLFKLDKDPISKINFVFLQNPAEHAQFVDRYSNEPEEIKKKLKGMGGISTVYGQMPVSEFHGKEEDTFRDSTAHEVAHWLTRAIGGDVPPWFLEGIAYFFSRGINQTLLTYCVSFAGTGGDFDKKIKDVKKWPSLVRQWVRTGNDPDINSVIKAMTVNDLDAKKTIKAWSICEFLFYEHGEKIPDFIAQMRNNNAGQQKDTGEKTFQDVFNWTLEDLDNEWRKFALRNY